MEYTPMVYRPGHGFEKGMVLHNIVFWSGDRHGNTI